MKVAERAPHALSFARSSGGSSTEYTDDEGVLPTRLFTRDGIRSGVMRAAPRSFRSEFPSSTVARALVAKMVRELRTLPHPVDASRPLTFSGSNVFLTPAQTTDPPPPWSPSRTRRTNPSLKALSRKVRERSRRSFLPLLTLAMAAAICFGLSYDESARASVISDLAHAWSRVGAFLLELAIR